jgi:hypothetical protein
MKDKTAIIIGAGMIPTFMTGRHAVMLMCKQTGRTFKTHAGDRA